MEFLPYYFACGAVIILIYGIWKRNWSAALFVALLWPLWVGYLLISLFWGIGSKL